MNKRLLVLGAATTFCLYFAWSEANVIHTILSSLMPMIVPARFASIYAIGPVLTLVFFSFVAGLFTTMALNEVRKEKSNQ